MIAPRPGTRTAVNPSIKWLIGIAVSCLVVVLGLKVVFDNLQDELNARSANERARLFVGEEIVRGIRGIEKDLYQLSVTANPAAARRVTRSIDTQLNKLRHDLNVLQEGGTVRREVLLNIEGRDQMVREATYVPTDEAGRYVMEIIEITPLLDEIDEGTVDFMPNYDGSTQEPRLLPARLPFVLLNGASGIAVGMATEIPPHNLREVAEALKLVIRKPTVQLDEVLASLPGPDFPGGGQIISTHADIRAAYEGGRGSIRMRCRWRIEELARGQWRVIVYELPHGVSTAQVLSEIEAVTNPQPRAGKKDVSQEQKNAKQVMLGVLDAVRDESNEKDPVRIVLEPRTSKVPQDEFMAVLLARTSLEANVSVNMTMMGTDGRPAQKNLLTMLHEWVQFRHTTVERRSAHRLAEVERRLHILAGRLLAFLSIDKIIKTIREADEPKAELMATSAPSPRTEPAPIVERLPTVAPAPTTAKAAIATSSPIRALPSTLASGDTPGVRGGGGWKKSRSSASAR